ILRFARRVRKPFSRLPGEGNDVKPVLRWKSRENFHLSALDSEETARGLRLFCARPTQNRRRAMTYSTNGAAAVLALEINRNGEVTKKLNPLDREHELTNTLLEALYPGIAVATVDVPQEELSPFERATVEQSLARLDWEGQKFALIGASGSAKNGKFYAVDPKREREIALRFGNWPEAAMTYFGILVSDCMVRIQKPECRVLVV